jgi:hypothetical protein
MSNSNEISLCIPRVFVNIDEKRVRSVFEQLLGKIYRVDIIERTNEKGEKYKRVFVHFEYWFETEEAQKAKARLEEGKELKIVYDDPWFWKVSVNKVNIRPRQRINLSPKQTVATPRIDFETDDNKVAATTQFNESPTHGQKSKGKQRLPIAPALPHDNRNQRLPIAPALPVRPPKNTKKYEPKHRNKNTNTREPIEDGELTNK